MAAQLSKEVRDGRLPPACEIRCGTTGDLAPDEMFDTALYIDVLEHIEDDTAEVARVCRHLAPGGHLIVLVPAHQALYTPFDAAIGHFRRYTMRQLLAVAAEVRPPGARATWTASACSRRLPIGCCSTRLLPRALRSSFGIAGWCRYRASSTRCSATGAARPPSPSGKKPRSTGVPRQSGRAAWPQAGRQGHRTPRRWRSGRSKDLPSTQSPRVDA